MKKKILAILLSILMMMGTFTVNVFAQEVGNTFYVDEINYKITSLNQNTGAVKVIGCSGNAVTIPQYVAKDNIEYDVTGIGSSAFINCSNLTIVTLPENLESIEASAFSQCSKLNTVICKATTPPELVNNAFDGCDANLKIYVPANKVDTYKQATGWSNYAEKIVAITTIASILPSNFPGRADGLNGWTNGNCEICQSMDFLTLDDVDLLPLSTVLLESEGNYFYTDYTNNKFYTFYMNDGALEKINLSGFTTNENGDYVAQLTIGDILKMSPNFPTAGSLNAPDNAWVNSANADATTFFYSNSSVLFFADSSNTDVKAGILAKNTVKKTGNDYQFSNNMDYKITFNMNDEKLFSIKFEHINVKFASLDGTYINPIKTVADILPKNFPKAKENGWISGTKHLYLRDSSLYVDDLGSIVQMGQSINIIQGTNDYKYEVGYGGIVITFEMDNNDKLEKVIIDGDDGFGGEYIAPITIADILETVEGGFPTSSELGWINENGAKAYINGDVFTVSSSFSLDSALQKDGNNYILDDGRKCTFVMTSGVLTKIIVEKIPPFGVNPNGTYLPPQTPITPTVSLIGWTYGDNPNAPSVTGNTGTGAVTYQYKVKNASDTTYTTDVPTKAGTYVVKAIIAETTYYLSGSATSEFTINKAPITPTVSLIDWTYGDNPNTPSITGNLGKGAVTYEYKEKDALDTSYVETKPSQAGNYVVKAIIDETDNYLGNTVTSEFTIFSSSTMTEGNISTATLNINENVKETKFDPVSRENALTIVGEGTLKEAINSGKDVIIYIEVKEPSDDSKKAFTSMNIDEKNALLLDINLYGKIVGEANSRKKITDTNGYKTSVSITLTKEQVSKFNVENSTKYFVLRLHDGVIEKIPASLNIDVNGNYIFTFETDKFSAYAICLEEESPNTGVNDLLMLPSIAIISLGVFLFARKKKNN